MLYVDHGNALLNGLHGTRLHKLQAVQNSAARLITGARRRDHIVQFCSDFIGCLFPQRIEFEILLLVCRAVHQLRPEYLTSLMTPCSPFHSLRSAGQRQLTIPRYHLEGYGRRSFAWQDKVTVYTFLATLIMFYSLLVFLIFEHV